MENKVENSEVVTSEVIHFKDGIPGFDERHKFVILQDEEYAPFDWLICVDDDADVELRFAMINPLIVYPEYDPDIASSLVADLEIEKPEDVMVYVLATIYPNPAESTINLMGPIVINAGKMVGKQVILENTDYSTKEPIVRN